MMRSDAQRRYIQRSPSWPGANQAYKGLLSAKCLTVVDEGSQRSASASAGENRARQNQDQLTIDESRDAQQVIRVNSESGVKMGSCSRDGPTTRRPVRAGLRETRGAGSWW